MVPFRILLAVVLFGCGCVACRHVQPWERTKLAHPTMSAVGSPGPSEEHMYSVHEGAVGGGETGSGGCGCN